jgi:Ca2+-binding RTX toxin-like protein
MTRRLITAVAIAMAFAAATAYATVAHQSGSHPCAGSLNHCVTIPPDKYPHGCHPNGVALQGLRGGDDLDGTPRRDLLRGGPGNDGLIGMEQRDCLFGQRGGDDIDGRRGNDWIRGGKGEDILDGGTGDDLIQGGRGEDFSIQGFGGRDTIYGGPGADHRRRVIEAGVHRVRYVAAIDGGSGRDRIVDTEGHNDINCGKGIDTVVTNEKSHVEKREHVRRR